MSEAWHRGMLLAFDLETTGVDVENDRIVTACCALVDGAGNSAPQVREWLAWPGTEIPEGATAVHGVTTERAREHGLPAGQVAGEVAETILEAVSNGVPLIVFNAAYDLTLLDRECGRHGLAEFGWGLDCANPLVIDPFVLDKALDRYRKGSRKLGDMARHYGAAAGKAHDAAGDAVTAARVAWKIAGRWQHVATMGRRQLMVFQRAAYAEQARSLRAHREREGKDTAGISEAWPWHPVTAGAAS